MNNVRDEVRDDLWNWVYDKTNEICEYGYSLDVLAATDYILFGILFPHDEFVRIGLYNLDDHG